MAEVVLFKELYSWQNDHDQVVLVDGASGVVIYQNVYDKSLHVIESSRNNGAFNRMRFAKPLCESVAFSSGGSFLLYWHNNPLAIGIVDLTDSAAEDVTVDSAPYEETIVLKVFWAESGKSATSDFVVVCTTCIDIYNFSRTNRTIRRICSKRISCSDVWSDVGGTHIIVLKNNQTLQPYRLVNKEVRLVPNVELSTKNDLQFQKSAISVATIYNETYCIHKDPANGTISLRSLINSKAYDIVLELRCQGWLEIAVVDNLLLALTGGGETYIFDIAVKDKPLLAKVPQRKPPIDSISSDIQAFIPNVVVDYYGGFAYNLTVDHNMLTLVLSQSYADAFVADFYQRRVGAVQRVMDIVTAAIANRARTDKLLALFFTIVVPYAKTLMEMNKVGTKTANSVAIPFNLVEEYVGERSIVTEYRFAKTILYAHVANEWRLKPGENIFDAAIALLCHHKQFDHDALLKVRDEMDIQSGFVNNFILKSKLTSGTRDEVSPDFRDYLVPHEAGVPELHSPSVQSRPHIITVMLCYFKALMAHHLQPTHLLQILLFDVCVLYNNVSLALHLQSASVIRDSTYVCYRMLCLYLVVRDPAIRQQCLDMALRLRLHDICVMLSVYDREYLDALVFLRAHRVSAYPLHRVLYRAAGDVEAQERKPHLWPSLLAFIRCWVEESAADAKACPPPNLKDCDMWLPNL